MLIALGWICRSGDCPPRGAFLLVDRVPVGVVEGKKQGTTLSTVVGFYAENLLEFLAKLIRQSILHRAFSGRL